MERRRSGYNAILSEDRTTPWTQTHWPTPHCAGIVAAEWDNDIGVAGVVTRLNHGRALSRPSLGFDIWRVIRGYIYQAAAKAGEH